MRAHLRLALISFVLLSAAFVAGQSPDVGGNSAAQDAADAIRAAAGADIAFLPAGLVKSGFDKDNLASLLQYPTEEVLVVGLTGAQVRAALELSVSLYPQPNKSFLQLSGVEAAFSKTAPSNKRLLNVAVNGVKLDDSRSYTVAMPSSLAKGGLGYFKVWDKSQIQSTLKGKTIESLLLGKRSAGSASRWSAQ
ncbi:MAG TPA: 5'-nucleotidase [Fimbriimonas sp.]|nr:5'-nucleotidase [Fimbriimonas sp.]